MERDGQEFDEIDASGFPTPPLSAKVTPFRAAFAKAARGRPTKLTPEVSKNITHTIAGGNYLETSAAYAGVSKVTLYTWLKRGRKQKTGIYRDFLDDVEQAMATAEMRDVLVIGKAANKHWQAAAWRLERKFPQRWGRKTEGGSSGSSDVPQRPWSPDPDR